MDYGPVYEGIGLQETIVLRPSSFVVVHPR